MKPLQIGDKLVCVDFEKRTRDPAKYLKPDRVYTVQSFAPYTNEPIIDDGVTGPQSEQGRAWNKSRFALVEKIDGPIKVGDLIQGKRMLDGYQTIGKVTAESCFYGCCYVTAHPDGKAIAPDGCYITTRGAYKVKITPVKPIAFKVGDRVKLISVGIDWPQTCKDQLSNTGIITATDSRLTSVEFDRLPYHSGHWMQVETYRLELAPAVAAKPPDSFAAGLTSQMQNGAAEIAKKVEAIPVKDPLTATERTQFERGKPKAKPETGLYTAEPAPKKKAAVNARAFAQQSLELAEEQYLRSCGWTKRRDGNWNMPKDHPKYDAKRKDGYVTAHALNSTRFWLGTSGRQITEARGKR